MYEQKAERAELLPVGTVQSGRYLRVCESEVA